MQKNQKKINLHTFLAHIDYKNTPFEGQMVTPVNHLPPAEATCVKIAPQHREMPGQHASWHEHG